MVNIETVIEVGEQIKREFKQLKNKRTVADSKLVDDATRNVDVPIDEVFEVIDIERESNFRNWVTGFHTGLAIGVGGLLTGMSIGKWLASRKDEQ